jgi:hypothetical protein
MKNADHQDQRRRRNLLDEARVIVEWNGGGYGIGLVYARDMIQPA